MKCPNCATNIGLFSAEMRAIHRNKACPHCAAGVRFGLRHGRFALGFLAVAIPAIVFGLSSPIAAGIAGGAGAAVGMGLIRSRR